MSAVLEKPNTTNMDMHATVNKAVEDALWKAKDGGS